MNAVLSRKRLRAAEDLLGQMERACSSVVHKAEAFETIFTAFISAARSVMHVMSKEDERRFKLLFPRHDFGLTGDDDTLWNHMRELRDETLKEGTLKSLRNKPDEIAVHNEYSDESGQFVVTAPLGFTDDPPLTLKKPRYCMNIDGQDRDAIELCRRYVGILNRIVEKFEQG